jgi:hypothetical protein
MGVREIYVYSIFVGMDRGKGHHLRDQDADGKTIAKDV